MVALLFLFGLMTHLKRDLETYKSDTTEIAVKATKTKQQK